MPLKTFVNYTPLFYYGAKYVFILRDEEEEAQEKKTIKIVERKDGKMSITMLLNAGGRAALHLTVIKSEIFMKKS